MKMRSREMESLAAAARAAIAGRAHDPGSHVGAQAAKNHGVAMLIGIGDESERHQTLRMVRQLRLILDSLRDAGIPALAIKGPALSATAYGDVTARGASLDLDLAVRDVDFAHAIEAIAGLGYRRVEPALDEHDHNAEEWQTKAHLFPLAGGVPVDLHTELIGNTQTTPLDLDAVLARAERRDLFGTSVLVPSPEDLLLYLCLHGARHHWSRLLWLCDVTALLRTSPVDWSVVFGRAEVIDARHRLDLGLHLAREVLGAEVPASVRAGRGRVSLALRRMEQTSRGNSKPRLAARIVRELAARETMRQRIEFLARQLAPNARDRAWIPLPRSLAWLHYALRPIRLILRYGRGTERS